MKDKPVILVVDDSPQNIELLEAYLVVQGYEIVKAENGEEALRKLSDYPIDLILLDVMMPGMDGFEVTRRVRQDNTHRLLPIILVTALRAMDFRVKGIEAGCDDFISKPVDEIELLARVRSLLKVKAYNDLMSNYRKELESEVTKRTEELKHALENMQQDITKRKNAEDDLQNSEEKYRTILENIEEGYYELDLAGNFTFFNDSMCRIMGYPREELMGMNNRVYTNKVNAKKLFQAFNEVYRTEKPGRIVDNEIIRKDGINRYLETSISLHKDSSGNPIGFRGVVRDISEQKQVEEKLLQSEEKYRSIVENAQEGIYQSTPEGRYLTLNHAFAKMLGYESPEELMATITDIAHQLYVNTEDRKKLLQLVEEQSYVRGYKTEFYRKDGNKIWVSINMHAVRDDQGHLLYYQGIDEDITLEKKIDVERQENIERLRKSLGATINAMAATGETRDPYTAGHQRRVADLARAIATEMNLTGDQIDGIRMASMIHDVGKISIPSEILTKPTQLTDLEFNLIKTHSQSGYNILKDIDFPWPIARIVLEHHERINGSGYPNGLKGEQILLESRILAIADVVEAISSHRPYRPAHGIEVALDEITKNKGSLYDPALVDACLRLFREKKYKMAA
jgi:PAS domain S-box-containing protein